MSVLERVIVGLALVAIVSLLVSACWIWLDPAVRRDRLRDDIRARLERER